MIYVVIQANHETKKMQSLKETTFTISGPCGNLEIRVDPPRTQSTQTVALICHPHPLHGGTLHNKVVTTLARTFSALGATSVRFHFRGVGKSQGSYDKGKGEVEDGHCVLAWIQAQFKNHALWLSGFSFGGAIAIQLACQLYPQTPIARLITIAPALIHFPVEVPTTPLPPWLLVMGEQDEIVPTLQIKDWIAQQRAPASCIYLKEVGHFFHGNLTTLKQTLLTALSPDR